VLTSILPPVALRVNVEVLALYVPAVIDISPVEVMPEAPAVKVPPLWVYPAELKVLSSVIKVPLAIVRVPFRVKSSSKVQLPSPLELLIVKL